MSETTHKSDDKHIFGFWLYLMTDCVLFASLFATFAVLRNSVWDGPSGSELFSLKYVWVQTLVLLASSLSVGLALISARLGQKRQVLFLLVVTGLLGYIFLGLELHEFRNLVEEGYSWRRSGFLSAFFTLVGMHGLHILVGLIWLGDLLRRIASQGLTATTVKRLTLFTTFWHFLDIIWIFIFTIVYLMGVARL